MGRLRNLDKYVTNLEIECASDNIEIIPLLVTESPIGDYDLINRNQGYLDKRLKENGLEAMLRWKPIIINLEDIGFFWRVNEQSTITHEFINKLLKWRNTADKGKYWYCFGNYSNNDKRIINNEYLKVFSHANITSIF